MLVRNGYANGLLNSQKKLHVEYVNAMMFTGMPNLPKLHLACGRASFRRRRRATQPTEMIYVAISAVELRDSIALNAAVLPRLITLITIVKQHVNMIELAGTCHFG